MAIKFEIYRDGNRLTNFTPAGAVCVGPESVPIAGTVRFESSLLICEVAEEQAIGVALLWDLGQIGSYQVETTRLPAREKPYNLNVELARFRLMRIVQKQEDWNLFDFPRAERFTQVLREAQAVFADALGKLDKPAEAAALADQAHALALDLSEQLAWFHSDLLLNRRRTAGAFVRHVCGCRAIPAVGNQKYKDTISDHFDYVVLPTNWRQIQPQEQVFNTGEVDEWVEYLARKRVPIIAGPLVNLHELALPDWLFIWEHDFETLRELCYEYVQKIVQRYRKAVGAWNVVSGLNSGAHFNLSFEQIIELTRMLVAQVKALLPNAKTLVSINQPFGEYHAKGGVGVPPLFYAEMVAQAGVNFEAFGIEIEMGVADTRQLHTRPLSILLPPRQVLHARTPGLSHRSLPPAATPPTPAIYPVDSSTPPMPVAGIAPGIQRSRLSGSTPFTKWPIPNPTSNPSPGPTSPTSTTTSPAAASSTTCSGPSQVSPSFRTCAKSCTSRAPRDNFCPGEFSA